MAGANESEIARLELLHAENPRGRVFAHLAEAYRRAGDAARAREVLRRGLADHPDYPSAHVVLGRVHEDLGDSQAAGAAFARVLELDPHNMIALRRLARAAEREGRSDEALGYWTELLSLDPDDEEVEASIHALRAELEGGATQGPSGEAGVAADADPAGVDDRSGGVALPPAEPDPFEEEVLLDPGPPIRDTFDDVDTADPPVEIEAWGSFAPDAAGVDAPVATGGALAGETAPSPVAEDATPSDDSLGLIDLGATSLDVPDPPEAGAPERDPKDAAHATPEPEDGPGESLEVEGPAPGPLEIEGVSAEALQLEDAWPEMDAGGGTGSYGSGFDGDDPDAFGGLETETLADLYAAQGLHGRAAAVYRRLLARSPGDPRLEAKLAEVEARVAEGLEEPVRPEWEDAGEPGAADPAHPTIPAAADARRPDEGVETVDDALGAPEVQEVPEFREAGEAPAEAAAAAPAAARDPLEAAPEAAGDPLEAAPASTRDALEEAPEGAGDSLEAAPEATRDAPEAAPAEAPEGEEWAPLAAPDSVDAGTDEPELFVDPFSYGEPDDVVLGADWGEPGGAAVQTDPGDEAPAAQESGRLWTGEEFGDAFPVGGPDGDAPEGTGSEGATAGSAGYGQGFGGPPAFFGPAGRIPDDADPTAAAATIAGTEASPAERDDLSDALERALPASAPDENIRDALGELLAWKPGQQAREEEASPDRPEGQDTPPPREIEGSASPAPREPGGAGSPAPGEPGGTGSPAPGEPGGTGSPASWEPDGSASPAPDRPPAPPPETSGAPATQPSPPAPTPPPPDLETEPWAASPVSGSTDARGPAPGSPILELGVDDLVRPAEPASGSRDSAAAAEPAAPGSVEPAGAPTGEGDLGDFARSLLDQSVEPEAGEEDVGSDDEELEVFRSWLRSLKK